VEKIPHCARMVYLRGDPPKLNYLVGLFWNNFIGLSTNLLDQLPLLFKKQYPVILSHFMKQFVNDPGALKVLIA
jgi:hypothetical protein